MNETSIVNQVLAIETAGGGFSVAVLRDGAVAAQRHMPQEGQQAKLLVPAIAEIMREAALEYAALPMVVAAAGPGGFTGLRIGLSAALGISLAAGCPAYGVNTLHALAENAALHGVSGTVWAVMNAGKGEVAAQAFMVSGIATAQHDMVLLPPDALHARIPSGAFITGDVFLLPDALKTSYVQEARPDAAMLARLAASRPESRLEPLPLYVRPPDAKLPSATI
ncbi:MAG: tRNA (adenosine(37)-N6)-threonylcarbamoyltransferase complex dimerization subunit type 1 TsaB [Alphaproteobacteria bacterium]|nr:tRNA (adenosine(37)-N6)-threonylcarbamoyltransferase complex dimerization subunit type 1 TsaB [Alphaproteobacteria bacterium]